MFLCQNNIDTLTIGADPELFVRKGRHFVSGHLFPCGTKEDPMPTKHGAIQNDGLALEMNIIPARTQDEFVTNMDNAIGDLREFLRACDPEAEVVARPSVFFGKSKLRNLPPYVYDLGCTPDYNAYFQHGSVPVPKPDFRTPFRTGAGHIHIGWSQATDGQHVLELCGRLARRLDLFLGLPSVLWDKDSRRRKLYGAAGSFRLKPYGMEYRVLSNAWVGNERLTRFVYQQTIRACRSYVINPRCPVYEMENDIRKIIDESEQDWPTKYPALLAEVEKDV